MFAPITLLDYRGKHRHEHVWMARSASGEDWVMAGAMLGSDTVRLRVMRGMLWNELRYALVDGAAGTLPYHSWSVIRGDETWESGSHLNQQEHFERTLLEPYLAGFSSSGAALRYAHPLNGGEHLFSLGERAGSMDKRGQVFPIWNVDPPLNHSDATVTMYTSIPFYLSLNEQDGRTYGVFIDHMGNIEMDMGHSDEQEATATVQGESIVVYYFQGPTPADVLRQYTELTGRMPMPPRWAVGYHQARWSYMSEQEVNEIATQLRQRRHPCDAIWLDIDYMHSFKDFTWDPERFSDPRRLADNLHAQGLRLVTIIDPGIKSQEDYAPYQQGQQLDYFCRESNGTMFEGTVWPGVCVFPDFSRSSVRAWWGQLHHDLVDQGIDAFWDDMNEPALFIITEQQKASLIHGNTMDDEVLHQAERDDITGPDGPPVTHAFFHNAYGLEMARATREGLLRLRPGTRPFVLTRSGTAGMQRYAANWTGDNTSRWEHIALAISMCLNISMSGVPITGVDIGGFWGNSSGELLTRFAQLGALLPFCRNHSAQGTLSQEPWAFGEPFESAYRVAIETRYRLLPYLYTLLHEASLSGSPVMRPLYYHYPQDALAIDVETAFLVGDALLSAPITTEQATSRQVYLPSGAWYDFWDGTLYTGGVWHEILAPLERWPLFARGNSIIPTGPLMQHSAEHPTDPLDITCYMTENGQASYTLYEDDGSSFDYTGGIYALTTFACFAQGNTITVHIDEQFENYRPQREEYHVVVWHDKERYEGHAKAGQGHLTLTFDRQK